MGNPKTGFENRVISPLPPAGPQQQHLDPENSRHADAVAGDVVPREGGPQQPPHRAELRLAGWNTRRLEKLYGQAEGQGQPRHQEGMSTR